MILVQVQRMRVRLRKWLEPWAGKQIDQLLAAYTFQKDSIAQVVEAYLDNGLFKNKLEKKLPLCL